MRITSLNLEAGDSLGLLPAKMAPLSQLVVLAGPNGAGKSRILRLVGDLMTDENLLLVHRQAWALAAGPPGPLPHRNVIEGRHRHIQFDRPFELNRVAEFVPKVARLKDYRALTERDQESAERGVLGPAGVKELENRATAYIARIARKWFSATHQALQTSPSEKDEAIREYERLRTLLRDLIGEDLSFNLQQHPTLFGKSIAEANLSDGQALLLQLAVALHAQGSKLEGLVLLLDEPESHIHPAAIIQAIDRLRGLNQLGQLWIATHSVPILAAVPTESVWYVHGGTAAWAGRNPEIVLEGLLGGPEGREKVHEFLRLPAQLATNRFAAECLLPPAVVDTGSDDPQAEQVRQICTANLTDDAPLRILDYGAGVGRLLSALCDRWSGARPFAQAIDYRAFEPYPHDLDKLRGVMGTTYGDATEAHRLAEKPDELSMLDGNSFDVVILCNVLHELPLEQWPRLFGPDGTFPRLLQPKGKLLILEDQEIPHGERAHRFGFLLLDKPHLYTLLACTEKDPPIQTFEARNGRLKAHVIPAELLGRTNRGEVSAALKGLRETARERIKEIRERPPDSRNGRLHALWTQLFANADLGLESLQ